MLLELLRNFFFFALHVENNTVFPKPLSKKEEEECFIKMSEGDKKAKDMLISIGTIGLIKAVSTFDFSKGAKFATYASRCIDNEILMNFRAAKKSAGDIYINEPVETDKDGNTLTLIDLIDDGVDIHEQIDILIRSRQLYRFLDTCLEPRELEIIVHRYGLYGRNPHTHTFHVLKKEQ